MGVETVLTIAGLASTVASIGGTVYGMTNKPKQPDLPLPSGQAAREAAYAEAERMRKVRAAQSSFATGPMGVTGDAPVRKTALGE